MIAFDEGPGLVLCVSCATVKENICETYRATLWLGLHQGHRGRLDDKLRWRMGQVKSIADEAGRETEGK